VQTLQMEHSVQLWIMRRCKLVPCTWP